MMLAVNAINSGAARAYIHWDTGRFDALKLLKNTQKPLTAEAQRTQSFAEEINDKNSLIHFFPPCLSSSSSSASSAPLR